MAACAAGDVSDLPPAPTEQDPSTQVFSTDKQEPNRGTPGTTPTKAPVTLDVKPQAKPKCKPGDPLCTDI
jgi:hypothetical protein